MGPESPIFLCDHLRSENEGELFTVRCAVDFYVVVTVENLFYFPVLENRFQFFNGFYNTMFHDVSHEAIALLTPVRENSRALEHVEVMAFLVQSMMAGRKSCLYAASLACA